jgi:hypothetical protein
MASLITAIADWVWLAVELAPDAVCTRRCKDA